MHIYIYTYILKLVILVSSAMVNAFASVIYIQMVAKGIQMDDIKINPTYAMMN